MREDGSAMRGVEGRERLVQHKQPGRRCECAGEGDALSLSAGEVRDSPVHQVGYRKQICQGVRLELALGARGELVSVLDVLAHAHVGEERAALEYVAEAALFGWEVDFGGG